MSTVRSELVRRRFKTIAAFSDRVQEVFQNATETYGPESEEGYLAEELSDKFKIKV